MRDREKIFKKKVKNYAVTNISRIFVRLFHKTINQTKL